ncbi:transposable element Tcb2 transposase [Trichonephila clavipes]|nr:transposable element Tcb2 transposase [Trichonephila clavipes]
MVWGAIAYNTRSSLVFILGHHDSPAVCVQPFFNKTIFGLTRQDYLRIVTILPRSARFQGLSPIEHIWDHLGRRVGHPTSLNKLEARLQQIWNEMSQDIIQNSNTPNARSIESHRAFALEGAQ